MVDSFSNAAQTTLSGSIDDNDTTLTVVSATGFPSTSPFRILIDTPGAPEICTVTAGAGTTTWTVTRGSEAYAGSSSTYSHTSGDTVKHVLTAAGLMSLQSNSTFSSAYASPPSSPISGDIWVPTDSYYDFFRYNGSAWVPFIDGIECTLPDNTGFSWVNQGTSTLDTSKGAHIMTTVAGENGGQHIRVKSAPSTPYTITAAFRALLVGNQFPAFYIVHRESGTSELRITGIYIDGGPTLSVDNWTSETVFSARPVGAGLVGQHRGVVWLRITDDGTTNCTYAVSYDGRNYITLYTIARTTFLTPNQVGWAGRPHASFGSIVTLLSWKET